MKATILVGIPMSGKSTLAKKLIKEQDNTVIIECDEIRKMLTGEIDKYKAFNLDNEALVWNIFDSMIQSAIVYDKNIIISNTNTNLKKLKELVKELEVDYEIEFIIVNTEIDTCVNRLNQEHSHMIPIINRMNSQIDEVMDWILEENKYYWIVEENKYYWRGVF
jgi:predicted kinase